MGGRLGLVVSLACPDACFAHWCVCLVCYACVGSQCILMERVACSRRSWAGITHWCVCICVYCVCGFAVHTMERVASSRRSVGILAELQPVHFSPRSLPEERCWV